VVIERPHNLVHARLGRPVAVPAAEAVVGYAADARGHDCGGGDGGETVHFAGVGGEGGLFLGEEGREVLEHQHGAEGVCAEGEEGVVGVYLGGGFFGVQDAGDHEGEVEVVRGGREVLFACFCCVCDGRFVCGWVSLCCFFYFRVATTTASII
jgi:hypothetical protein